MRNNIMKFIPLKQWRDLYKVTWLNNNIGISKTIVLELEETRDQIPTLKYASWCLWVTCQNPKILWIILEPNKGTKSPWLGVP